ncbi:D-erythronate dehydrogenase [Primorskyibacter marinus]|uniref:D-erythronate dehydrogenase n=1 Tax=Primorskyibacter marinus TaxID=1977320 RepID=UPI000E30023B|nr:D-erythronate dehydrogenase [Primorskyibacter marinus]
MNILIIGGGGLIGQKLAHKLIDKGELRGQEITGMVLADIVDPALPDAPFPISAASCDIGEPAAVANLIDKDIDVIYLLAAVVSGQAESDFDIGMRVNLHGALNVLERCRALETTPVVVFTSSMAVFGGDVPDPIEDWTIPNPQTSYGTQKAIGELLVNDYSRKGFIDGRAFRLPTISVRPGKPNLAASSFMSSIFREPLNGQQAICPVDRDFAHFYLSPRRCVDNLIRGAEIDGDAMGTSRTMMMPGRTWTIGQMIDAMTAVAGPEPARLIRFEDQPEIQAIVKGWKFDLNPAKALSLGLSADESFEENIRYYMQDDLPRA